MLCECDSAASTNAHSEPCGTRHLAEAGKDDAQREDVDTHRAGLCLDEKSPLYRRGSGDGVEKQSRDAAAAENVPNGEVEENLVRKERDGESTRGSRHVSLIDGYGLSRKTKNDALSSRFMPTRNVLVFERAF